MHHLAMIALGDIRRGAVVRTAGMMAATILLMAATLQRAAASGRASTRRSRKRALSGRFRRKHAGGFTSSAALTSNY